MAKAAGSGFNSTMFPFGEEFNLDSRLLGEFLRAAREEECLTVRQVADDADLDFSHISKVELGRLDVSVANFMRICFALCLPPGVVLESCSFVSRTIYQVAFFNDDQVKAMASDKGAEADTFRKEAADFLAGTALAVSYLLKSTNPAATVERMSFPVPTQRDRLKAFAKKIPSTLSPLDRRNLLRRIVVHGYSALKALGLVDDSYLEAYLALTLAKPPKDRRPWIPLPKLPFYGDQINTDDPLKIDVTVLLSDGLRRKNRKLREESGKLTVDECPPSGMICGVSSIGHWKSLAKRIAALTSPPGAKARLAEHFTTSRQAVNKWLSGKGAPNADLTLRLLDWVQAEEAKQKRSPGRASTRPERKTQLRSSKAYEKTKPNPHKG
jgi:transcriptional regulator with XRE-family HTH domain